MAVTINDIANKLGISKSTVSKGLNNATDISPDLKKLVLDTLLELNEKHNMTIIITSSELAELKQVSDRIAIITEGKIQTILPADADDKLFGLAMSGEEVKEVID